MNLRSLIITFERIDNSRPTISSQFLSAEVMRDKESRILGIHCRVQTSTLSSNKTGIVCITKDIKTVLIHF